MENARNSELFYKMHNLVIDVITSMPKDHYGRYVHAAYILYKLSVRNTLSLDKFYNKFNYTVEIDKNGKHELYDIIPDFDSINNLAYNELQNRLNLVISNKPLEVIEILISLVKRYLIIGKYTLNESFLEEHIVFEMFLNILLDKLPLYYSASANDMNQG